MPRFDHEVTKKLKDLREEVEWTLVQAAAHFGYERGDTIREWESGRNGCPETKRQEFIDYLLYKLRLRQDRQGIKKFFQLWDEIMVMQWEWNPLDLGEIEQLFGKYILSIILEAIASIPRQLPKTIQHFTGREKELKQLLEALRSDVVITVWGPGGIGKSALVAEAIHKLTLANDLSERFPNGIIRYNFGENCHARSALIHIASSFNVPFDPANPGPAVDRALSGKRVLLILEGTENADNLDAVLSVRSQCGVVITTRKREHFMLGAQQISLNPFEIGKGVELLKKWSGTQIINDNIAEEICKLVGGLPLAIQLAGSYIERNKGDNEAYVDKVALEYLNWLKERPFEALELVQKLLEKSKAQLDGTTQQLLQVVGFLAPVPFDQQVIIEALATSLDKIRRPLDELINYSFLRRIGDQYEVVHNLIHTYASQEATDASSEITKRLVAYYTQLTELVETQGKHGEKKNYTKLNTVRPHIMATLAKVAERKEWQVAINLAQAIDNYLNDQGHWTDRVTANQFGQAAAYQLKDRRSECIFLAKRGRTLDILGNEDEANNCLEQALPISQEIEDRALESQILDYLGTVSRHQGQVENAIEYYCKALSITEEEETNDKSGQVRYLCSLGLIRNYVGQGEEAIKHHKEAVEIAREIEYWRFLSVNLGYLGAAYSTLKKTEKAIECYQEALIIADKEGDVRGVGNQWLGLGKVYDILGQEEKAHKNYEQALTIAQKIGDFRMEIDTRVGLAHLYARQENWIEALAQVEELDDLDLGLVGSLWAYLNYYKYKVLRDNDESDAQTILKTAYDLLNQRAGKINDEILRHSFRNNVAVHKEIIEKFEKSQRG